jgi:hypothetical protein
MPGWNVALPSDSVAFSGSFVPPAKSKSAKLDVTVAVELDDVAVVDDVVDVVELSIRVVVELGDVVVDVDPLDSIVAAPAATTQRIDAPAPTMEPVNLIFIFATPLLAPEWSYREVNKNFRSRTGRRKSGNFATTRDHSRD